MRLENLEKQAGPVSKSYSFRKYWSAIVRSVDSNSKATDSHVRR